MGGGVTENEAGQVAGNEHPQNAGEWLGAGGCQRWQGHGGIAGQCAVKEPEG